MTDIVHDWRSKRFIIPEHYLTDGAKCVILTDVSYWAKNVDDLVVWCESRNCKTMGMVVEFGDEATLLEFILRWA